MLWWWIKHRETLPFAVWCLACFGGQMACGAIVFVCIYIGILAPLACCGLWVSVSLIAIWVFFPWLLVFQGVCGCACALVCMRYLCFPGFYKLWSVQCLGHLLPPVSGLLQGFMCICTQVSGSVVSNWPLCEFCGRGYCDIWYIFLIPQFLRHQTMDKVQKHNSFNRLFALYQLYTIFSIILC
jgi:hypothetical protein